MANELQDFLKLSYTELEELNLQAKADRPDRGRLGLTVLEQDHHRDRGDAVALGKPLLLVDVDLDDLD